MLIVAIALAFPADGFEAIVESKEEQGGRGEDLKHIRSRSEKILIHYQRGEKGEGFDGLGIHEYCFLSGDTSYRLTGQGSSWRISDRLKIRKPPIFPKIGKFFCTHS